MKYVIIRATYARKSLHIESLAGIKGFNKESFEAVHQTGEQITSIRLHPQKNAVIQPDLLDGKVPWNSNGYYLKERPSFTLDPLFHAGAYYVQEASSMFLEHALQTCIKGTGEGLKILDLCAAPGGKSTLLASLYPDALIVSNEVIKSRAAILVENATKWGMPNMVVTNNDPEHFRDFAGYFDVIVVGIDNGGADRLSEYSPYDFKVNADEVNVWDVKGTGSLYLESLVKEVKPYIDQNYRTKKDVKHTIVCGSSMGGLISLYACMRYPKVFGTAGVFSPAFWTNVNDLEKEIREHKFKWNANIYMFAGELEGKRYTDNMNDISILLSQLSHSKIITRTISSGQHNESFWRSQMPNFITWISTSL